MNKKRRTNIFKPKDTYGCVIKDILDNIVISRIISLMLCLFLCMRREEGAEGGSR